MTGIDPRWPDPICFGKKTKRNKWDKDRGEGKGSGRVDRDRGKAAFTSYL
jgi:hypothetical protein